jgi:hypothetical protein
MHTHTDTHTHRHSRHLISTHDANVTGTLDEFAAAGGGPAVLPHEGQGDSGGSGGGDVDDGGDERVNDMDPPSHGDVPTDSW